MQLTEHQIQQLIINYLQAKRYYVQRLNAGQYSVGEGRNKRYIMGVAKGTGDILIGIPFKHLALIGFVEVKREGGRLSPAQEYFKEDMKRRNIFYCVAHSLEELQYALEAYLNELRSV